tara:strand:+ start:28 stop:294 length:267 start_codon:yes stop_codon:yes gene_type:complete
MAQIIVPRRTDDWLRDGVFTLRAYKYFEDTAAQVNTTTEEVATVAFNQSFSAQLQQIRKELNGLPEFTVDTTGFTTDTTLITTDKVIA